MVGNCKTKTCYFLVNRERDNILGKSRNYFFLKMNLHILESTLFDSHFPHFYEEKEARNFIIITRITLQVTAITTSSLSSRMLSPVELELFRILLSFFLEQSRDTKNDGNSKHLCFGRRKVCIRSICQQCAMPSCISLRIWILQRLYF